MATSKSGKKVVRVESSAAPSAGGKGGKAPAEPTWTPTPEAKGKAGKLRFIAIVLWLLAIAGEAFTIFVTLKKNPVPMWQVYVAIGVIGVLAIIGSLLWKKANDADPARRSQPVKFFIQNQLGAIIAVIAFLPLIIMIFTNKNMSKKDRNIAGTVAAVVAAIAVYFGIDFNPSSVEGYTAETQRVVDLTGEDFVAWTTFGNYYHLCEDAPAVNLESSDGTISTGTVGDAHANGKKGITLELEEELAACGFPIPENVDEIVEEIRQERP